MKRLLSAFTATSLSALLLLAFPASSFAALRQTGSSSVSFTATGPGGMRIVGRTSELQVSERNDLVVVRVPLARLETGIGLRDSHMRDRYLEVARFPFAELTIQKSALHLPGTADLQGQVTIHGQTKPARFHYEVRNEGGAFTVHGNMRVNMNDFGINVPSYLGVTVRPEVQIEVSFAAQER